VSDHAATTGGAASGAVEASAKNLNFGVSAKPKRVGDAGPAQRKSKSASVDRRAYQA
jgi:hypothetical protein